MEEKTSNEFIKVFCRVRPLNSREQSDSVTCISSHSPHITFTNGTNANHSFIFDSVFDEQCPQNSLFETFGKDITNHCLRGYNGCIFAYGQTGSGKTYTILGPPQADGTIASDPTECGLLPRTLDYVFDEIRVREAQENVHYSCFVSFMEIYNEKMTDLLDATSDKKLNILHHNSFILLLRENATSHDHHVTVENLSIQAVSNSEEARRFVEQGLLNRRVGVTNMNVRSSRSHAVFTLYITCEEVQDAITVTRKSQFHLIDLAGSERQSLTGTGGESLKEACYINSSLSALGNVIRSLTHREGHIPYRDSRLTYLLRDSLGGNSLTSIIATVSPAQSAASETLSTLRFATDAKMIKNAAIINEVRFGSVAALQEEINRLQHELQLARQGHFSPSNDLLSSSPSPHSPSFSSPSSSQFMNYPFPLSTRLFNELIAAHRTAAEMYIQNANLWKEIEGMRDTLLRLRCELRIQKDVAMRLRHGQPQGEEGKFYDDALHSLIQTLITNHLTQNCNATLLQQLRLTQQSSSSSSSDIPSLPFADFSPSISSTTIADLHTQLAQAFAIKVETLISQEANEQSTKDQMLVEEGKMTESQFLWEKLQASLLPELEETRSRCDDLYADLLEVQEKLRMAQLQQFSPSIDEDPNEPSSKRVKLGELLLQRDCQFNVMREQRRIISHIQTSKPLTESCLGGDMEEAVADASQLQPANDFYHRLVSVGRPLGTSRSSHLQSWSLLGESHGEREQLQEQLESLTAVLEEKDRELDKLKFDLLTSSSQIEAERKATQEALLQSNDRLQQLVALQTAVSLEQQRHAQDSDRLAFLESDSIRLHTTLKQHEATIARLTAEVEEKVQQIQGLEAKVTCSQADNLMQIDYTNALQCTIEEKTLEISRLQKAADEQDVHRQLLEKQLQVLREEKQAEHAQVEKLTLSVQATSQENERLQKLVEEKQMDIQKANERDEKHEKETQAFRETVSSLESVISAIRQENQEIMRQESSNLLVNQLKDENRKLRGKLEIARKRLTNYGLSTTDIDAKSDEILSLRRAEEMMGELKLLFGSG